MLRNSLSIILVVISIAASTNNLRSAEDSPESWLRGTGKDLQIRLAGEILESDGQPATDVQVTCHLNSVKQGPSLEPKIEGHRFEVWLPVNSTETYSLALTAASKRTGHQAFKTLSAKELRQAAIEKIKFTLREPTRHLEVVVTDGGQPVAGATVKAELDYGIEARSKTGVNGIARFYLLPEQKLDSLTAWTDDYRVGGYLFRRTPPRDPNANEHVVELSKCREHKFRLIDESGSPVPDIEFVIQMATQAPFYFLRENENFRLKVNHAGEVMYRWFPDWEARRFYPRVVTADWFIDGNPQTDSDVTTYPLKKRIERKPVSGRVSSDSTKVGGFFVFLESFQGEEERTSDHVRAFTNADGTFEVDVLPDARYCAYVLDTQWVSKIIDLVPYVAASDQINHPELTVSEGQEVQIIATIGSERNPYANLPVNICRVYDYSWQEKGETQYGSGGPQWWVTTDAEGKAVVKTLPGTLTARAYERLWQDEQKVTVQPDAATWIELHCENEEKQTVKGQVFLAGGAKASIANAHIRVVAVDGKFQEDQIVKCGEDGTFSFDTLSNLVAIFGVTQDASAAGSLVVDDQTARADLVLRPTLDYQGQLLGEEDRPMVNRRVVAIATVEVERHAADRLRSTFEVHRAYAKTDAEGNYTLAGLPTNLQIRIHVEGTDRLLERDDLGSVLLKPHETRSRAVSRLVKKPE